MTAEDLVGLCKHVETEEHSEPSMACLMYISGVEDGFSMSLLKYNGDKQTVFCPPDGVTRTQIAKVIVKFGNDHPNQLLTRAAVFTLVA